MSKGDFKKAAGLIPWKEGDELPEDIIRRLRDSDPAYRIVQSFAEENIRLRGLLSRAINALEGWRILLDMPITDIMKDIEKELRDE